ncbi:AraC family transcriptional regulator [Streptococcus salivarius]|uniref:AraC family transcriptional regulator n=1 Tax=Streptococcus salivarius TaxID=1304 RepID=UPI0019190664|nr:helix-turn-helix domain-containing protein [Streptococcus salivarius]
MLIFSELETGTLDLRLDFYGYEDCLPDQFFGPAIRENYVLHYITEGKGYLEYRKQKISLQKGDIFLLIPGEVTYYFADNQTPWSYYWLGISGIKAQEYFNLSSIHDTAYLRSPHTKALGKFIGTIVKDTEKLDESKASQLHVISQLFELMHQLNALSPNLDQETISPSQKLYREAKHLIDIGYNSQDISIQKIADELGVHRSYLSSIFKDFHKISPKEYLLEVRMNRAKELLETTDQPIKIIANSVGYLDPLHFSKAFRQYYDCSPSQYRTSKQ